MNKRRYLPFATIFLFQCVPVIAQVDSASLTGLVTDPSHAAVRGANVSAINQATGLERSTVTDNAGYYNFPSLPVGSYQITVNQAGFETAAHVVALDPSAKARQDFELAVGATSTAVEVKSESPQISRDDASIGTVIENQVIQSTPLYQRNWDDLIRLVPGVQQNRFTEQSGATDAGRTGDFNAHGVHSLQNNFILDGVDNNTFSENVQELSTSATRPSVDVIQEFKVITNPYSAEYGRSPGTVVDVSTKSGSNQVHGLLFEYLRNRIFDANDYFSNQSGLPKPENIQNQFGGNFAAPIIKNKLFGFFNYEGTRIRQGVTRVSTVPLPNERVGNFSPAAGAANGVTYPAIYNIATGQQFANNTIPQSMLDPNALKIMNLFPLPNQPGEFNNYARTGAVVDDTDSFDGRLDWNATDKDLVFARATTANRTRDIPGYYGGIADGTGTSAWGNSSLKGQGVALGWTHIFSATLLNDFRLGFVHNNAFDVQQPFGMNHASDYVPGIPQNPVIDGGLPYIGFANYTFIGSPDFLPKQQNPQQWQYADTVAITKGAHSIKTGVDIRAPMRNVFQDEPDARGNVQFSGTFTCLRDPATHLCVNGPGGSPTGNSYADALLGDVQSSILSNVYFVDQRIKMFSGFVQDDWKATRKLTFNLGLRYEFATPPIEAKNQMANFDTAGQGSLVFASNGSLQDRALVDIHTKNFAPRFGFAYSPDEKTVFRGGYGIYYLLFERIGSEDQMALNPPFLIENNAAAPSTSYQPVFLLRNGFPANYLDPNNINYQLTQIRTVDPNSQIPYVQQWSFGLQRALPGGFVATVNYVGTKSTHLDVLTDLNQPVNGVTPYPNFGYLERQTAQANGIYHGLESSIERRFHNGLSLKAAYTWSKSIDNAPEELEGNGIAIQNGQNLAAMRGLSDFDIPQRVVVSYVLELPFGKGKPFLQSGIASAVLGGWRTSGVYTFASGLPFTVTSGGNYSTAIDPYGAATALPNVIGAPTIVGNTGCWFYVSTNSACQALAPNATSAFALQQLGAFGNSGRNTLRGPHTNVFDFSLMRDFAITERARLQARWEVFNLANTPQFALPNGSLSDSSAGTITSLASDPRIMQFALRFSF
jgi:Carboxypeptidase regulatory-like domain/TonB-dependent Receptor Plug Domain/TonB dependent receptor